MIQLYSSQKTFSAHFFKLATRWRISVSFLFLSVALIAQATAQDVVAKQSSSTLAVAGNWLLKEVTIRENGMEADSVAYAKSFWADHKSIPLRIAADGSIEYSREGKLMTAKVKEEKGKLVFYFPLTSVTKISDKGEISTNGNNFTTTVYDFSVSGSKMTLKKEDPEFFWQFVFKRQ